MSATTSTARTRIRRRPKHDWPVCPRTGKRRLGERKDVKLAVEAARHCGAQAALAELQPTWTVVRGYRCTHCGGWHLTSQPPRGRATAAATR